ncbi:MAG: trigger factor [Patescibacteria group bacterium]|jgi:trigger factor
MKVEVKKLPKSQAELIIELSPEELKPYLNQAVEEISADTKIPGFRPGKAPFEIVARQAGIMKIYQLAAEKAVSRTYPRAVKDNKLITVGSPQIHIEKIAPENPLIYKATVALLPQIVIGQYQGLKIARKEQKVEAKEIEDTMSNLQRMFGKEKSVTRPIQKTDKVEIDMETFVDKVPIDGGKAKNQAVVIGEGHFIPGFEESLIGLSIGQSKEFQLKFPKEYHKKELANRPAEFKVKINNIFEIELPPLNDEFAKMVGKFEKLDELRQQIENNIHREKEMKEQQRLELAITEKIVAKAKYDEIPQVLTDAELHKIMHELEHEVVNQGMKFEDYLASIKKTKEELEKEFAPKAEQRIKIALALREISQKEKIDASDQEVEAELKKQKVQYHDNKEVLGQIDSEEYRDYLQNMMRSRKVFEWLEKNNS